MKTKTLLVSIFSFCMALVWALGSVQAVQAGQATEDLRATIDQVIQVVTNEQYKNDKSARRAKMHDIIDARFSYEQMGMRSLAKEWNNRSDAEKRKFLDLFGKLLENSYASKIEAYSNEKINYKGEQVKGNYALVKTEVVRTDGTVGVDYKMIKLGGKWQVYDFVIEGVSMVRNYRSQFTKIIKKDNFSGLVDKLSQKIQDLESNNTASDQL